MHDPRRGVRLAAAVALAACTGAGWSAELTEQEAVARALARPAYAEWEAGQIGAAQGAVAEASRFPNPVLHLEEERFSDPAGRSTERTIGIEQTFDLSGRRTLRVEAAEQRAAAAGHDVRDRRQRLVADVRRSFAAALGLQRERQSLAEWLQRIEAASRIVGQLARSGEVAGYARRRIEREVQAAKARLAASGGQALRAQERLRGLAGLDHDAELRVVGELMPPQPPPLEAVLKDAGVQPDLAALLAQAEAFERERTAAGREWVPDLTLGVGHKRVAEPGLSDTGIVLSLSVPLPLFDRGDGRRDAAAARARALRAEHALLAGRREAEIRGAWREAAELRASAIALRAAPASALSRIAETAYRAGESGILELLDAYRTELDAELAALDLELRARLARIELDALSGAKRED
jgi:outer membrane protein, heavy metal efflux system